MTLLENISELVQKGNAKKVQELVSQAMAEKYSAKEILNEGLLAGMNIIGVKFKNNDVYVPEVLVAARAMNVGMKVLEPLLAESGVKPIGKVVVGTVQGDLHDIGKNLVIMMMKGAGLEVIDIGIDVPPEAFGNKAEEVGADVIALSALLTSTMGNMKDVMSDLEKRNLRSKYLVMVGGAPLNSNFAKEIGADCYAPDASSAAEVAKKMILDKIN